MNKDTITPRHLLQAIGATGGADIYTLAELFPSSKILDVRKAVRKAVNSLWVKWVYLETNCAVLTPAGIWHYNVMEVDDG